MILASCTVDELAPGWWRVEVWGGPRDLDAKGQEQRRVYTIDARTDNVAAELGMARFVEELSTPA